MCVCLHVHVTCTCVCLLVGVCIHVCIGAFTHMLSFTTVCTSNGPCTLIQLHTFPIHSTHHPTAFQCSLTIDITCSIII